MNGVGGGGIVERGGVEESPRAASSTRDALEREERVRGIGIGIGGQACRAFPLARTYGCTLTYYACVHTQLSVSNTQHDRELLHAAGFFLRGCSTKDWKKV